MLLPVEILSYIFEYFPMFYLLNIRLTCKYFNNVFEKYFLYDIEIDTKVLIKIRNLYQNKQNINILKKIITKKKCFDCPQYLSYVELIECSFCYNSMCCLCIEKFKHQCKKCKKIYKLCGYCSFTNNNCEYPHTKCFKCKEILIKI